MSKNPWVAVPLSDYEQHMRAEDVQQLDVLSDLFAEALARCQPSSVAVLGIAGGNGLGHIDSAVTTRVVGLDLNPQYLEATKERYSHLLNLELHCADLSVQAVYVEPVQLVHAALIFEHAGTDRCLENALAMVAPGGHLAVVLQLPSASAQAVAPSQFSSMQTLKSRFTLIDPVLMCQRLAGFGFHLVHPITRTLPAGKGFWMGIFRASS